MSEKDAGKEYAETIRSNRRLRALSSILGGLCLVLLAIIFWPTSVGFELTSVDPVDPPVRVFELTLAGFEFPKNLKGNEVNFKFFVNLWFTDGEGQYTTEQAAMPGLDTFWECDPGKQSEGNYVRAHTNDGEKNEENAQNQFDMQRINQWGPLILWVKGREVHSIRFEVFGVNEKGFLEMLKAIGEGIVKAFISEGKGAIPKTLPLNLHESQGVATGELESFLLKRFALAEGDKLLFRGWTKLDGIEFKEGNSREVTVEGKGKEGDYTIKFDIQKDTKSGGGDSVARPSSQKPT